MTEMPRSTARAILPKLWIALAAIIVGLACTSGRSFWMDEGGTAFRAMMPTLKEWWAMMLHLRGSDVQMPLYMLYAWFWHQHVGALSEYALRLSNLPWLVLAALVLSRVRFWPVVCLLSPFVLYFMDEFRPYTMQIAAGACAAAALGKVMDRRNGRDFEGVHAICGACVFLIACSLTGAVWACGAALGAAIARPDWLRKPGFWLRAAPWIAAALAAGSYYLFTMLKGYRAAEIQGAGLANVLFGIYEMTGLLGLGPGKDELRHDVKSVFPYLVVLVPAAACLGAAWLFGFSAWARTVPKRHVLAAACAAAVPLVMLTIVGQMMEFRVLGRHLSPAIPAILLPLAVALQGRGPARKTSIALGLCACVIMISSWIGTRFAARHDKDDFRNATALAIKALDEGKRVWWQADMNATRYYAFRSGGFALVNRIQVLESDPPTSPMFADVIFINRPDLRYRGQDHRKLLEKDFFKLERTLPGFEIWTTK